MSCLETMMQSLLIWKICGQIPERICSKLFPCIFSWIAEDYTRTNALGIRIHKKSILLQRIHCVYLESSLASFFSMPRQTLIDSWHLEPQPSTDSRCDNFLPLRSKKTKDIRGLSPLKQAVVELSVISAFDLPSISSLRSPQALRPYEEN